jgi:hypothetical protein
VRSQVIYDTCPFIFLEQARSSLLKFWQFYDSLHNTNYNPMDYLKSMFFDANASSMPPMEWSRRRNVKGVAVPALVMFFSLSAAPTQPPRRIKVDKITEVIGGHCGSSISELYTTVWTAPDFDCRSPERVTHFLKVMVFLQIIRCCYPLNKQTPPRIFRIKTGCSPTN